MAENPHATALRRRVADFLERHPVDEDPVPFLRARFDEGLAWVDWPEGRGGIGADRADQRLVDDLFEAAGAPDNSPRKNVIGLGMAAPTLLRWASPAVLDRMLRPLWTGEEIWCQLFSEPGAGSDLASVSSRAVRDGDDWVVSGQKVWTSLAHDARWALLLARTDPDVPKHAGLTYFVCDMHAAGVEVRALRQLTGEAEFNEVFLDDVRIPDAMRLGEVGEGWRVTQSTLSHERVAIGAGVPPRGSGPIAHLVDAWRAADDENRDRLGEDRFAALWIEAEALRLGSAMLRESVVTGHEGSAAKISYARVAQEIASAEMDLAGSAALAYDDWSLRRPDLDVESARPGTYRFLRAKANSIEGGTTEVLRNIVAERVLGLPAEPRTDVGVAWKDLLR